MKGVVARAWIFVALAGAASAGVVLVRCTRAAPPAARAPDDAGAAAVVAPALLPTAPLPAGTGVNLVVQDDTGSAPRAAVLTATGADGREVVAQVGPGGQGTLAIAPGAWTIAARTPDGAPLAVTRASAWQLGEQPPPWIDVRLAAVGAEVVAAPPSGPARLIGIATVDGARPADLIVTPIWLGGFGPGHAVTHDRIPQAIVLPARRFIGTGGAWSLEGVPAGGYALLVVVPWRGAALVRATATGELAGDGSAALTGAVQLSGSVLDQRGSEIDGATVSIRYGDLALAHTTTGSRGEFRFFDLPAGEVTIDARASGCFGEYKSETVAPGTDARVNLAIVCDLPAAPPP